MKIEQNKIVALTYTLESDGKLIETVKEDNPMEFMYGIGALLPKFEEEILNKIVGDTFDFVLKAADAYGEYDETAVVELPKEMFHVDGEFDEEIIFVGNQVPMQDEDGNRFQGVVKDIDETTVTMNFNHPLAGSDLHFTGSVIGVREATPEDLMGGGCGCGSGGCGSGCGDDCECGDDCDCSEDDNCGDDNCCNSKPQQGGCCCSN